MLFAGLDVHKNEIQAAILDDQGTITLRHRFPATNQAIQAFARKHLAQAKVALEATTNTWAIVRILTPLCLQVIVSNPLRTSAIAQAKIKTDKVDSLVLAQLLRSDFLPTVWQPDETTLQQRELASHRAALSHDRTRIKNRIHSILHMRLLHPPMDDIFGPSGREWLVSLDLDPYASQALTRDLTQLDLLHLQIEDIDTGLAKLAYGNEQILLLITLPGVDIIVAQALLAALGDISRFRDADCVASYLGLAPSTYQSGDHCYHGHITKQGSAHTRWLLIEAAQHIDSHPGPLGVYFRRIAKKKNRNVAVVACARKLAVIAYHMLKNNEPYRYAQPKTVAAKLSRLRVRATGEKRKGGYAKGSSRPSNYGSGVRTKTTASLDAIYASEGLPPLPDLAPGEVAMLDRTDLRDYKAAIHQPTRRRRNVKASESASTDSPQTTTSGTQA